MIGPLEDYWTLALKYHGIPGDPKYYCGPPVAVTVCEDQVINKVLAQTYCRTSPVGSQAYPVVFSPVEECIIGTDILNS